MHCQLLIARGTRTTFFQPANTALSHIPSAIARSVIAQRPSTPLPASVPTRRNDGSHTVRAYPLPNALRVIGTISANAPRPLARSSPSPTHATPRRQRLKLRRFMRLSSCQQRCQGDTSSIDQHMDFCPKSTFGTAKRMGAWLVYKPPFFGAPAAERLARIEELSTHHCSQSSWSRASSCSRSARSIL